MYRKVPLERIGSWPPNPAGLTSSEVEHRRQAYGPNDILEVAGSPWRELALDTASDPMIWFLVGIAVLYAALGSTSEAITLGLAILPLVAMDAFLHRRTQASTRGLSRQLAERASVFRDGTTLSIPAVELVPGDLVRVEAGDFFPADGIIVSETGAQVDESSLTGEAYPVRKQALPSLPRGPAEADVENVHWAFAGTHVLTGSTILQIVFTGQETLYGGIVRSAVSSGKARTPLQRSISSLVSFLLAAAAVLCACLAFVRIRQGYGWLDALVSAATLAVAALPEEFPVVFTAFLGVGVYRLAQRRALVRRAVSVENIGRVSCICSDKTGTLTEGRLHLSRLLAADEIPESRLLTLASLVSRRDTGDPLDGAVHHALDESGHPLPDVEIVETYPFTESRRRETVVVREGGVLKTVTKGAPEVMLSSSDLSEKDRLFWTSRIREVASQGHKVLGCAWRNLDSSWTGGEPDRGYRFAGLLGFRDPPREGVPQAVDNCRRAGIRIIMVTGDHPETARAIATDIGLGATTPRIVSGTDLEVALNQGEDAAVFLKDVVAVARALPAHKMILVQALQALGEIVAVTGDGVNDVPALQAADIGIAMGQRGTRSAREVASIVLLDDNFRTIVNAIAEGRQLFRNLKLSFQYLLMIHIPFIVTATVIPLAGYPLLFLPIHVVWLEALIHPTALLVFQELPATTPLERVAGEDSRFFTRREWALMATVGALLTLLIVASYDRSLGSGGIVEHARAMALVGLTCSSAAITAALTRLRTKMARFMVAASVALAVLLVQIAPIADRLHVRPLHLDDWAVAMVGALACVLAPMAVWQALTKVSPAAVRKARS